MPVVCFSGRDCGLCFTRRTDHRGRPAAMALGPYVWRKLLGPTTRADRLGTFQRAADTYRRVGRRE